MDVTYCFVWCHSMDYIKVFHKAFYSCDRFTSNDFFSWVINKPHQSNTTYACTTTPHKYKYTQHITPAAPSLHPLSTPHTPNISWPAPSRQTLSPNQTSHANAYLHSTENTKVWKHVTDMMSGRNKPSPHVPISAALGGTSWNLWTFAFKQMMKNETSCNILALVKIQRKGWIWIGNF